MKLIFGVLIAVCTLVACSGGETGDTVSETTNAGTSVQTATHFVPSGFSNYLEKSEDGKWAQIAFSFFPDGTDFDFETKTAKIPCAFMTQEGEGVSAGLSAPLEPCSHPYELIFSDAREEFGINGIVVPLTTSYSKFAADFGVEITASGVRDTFDSGLLASSRGKLEDFMKLIQEKKELD